MVLAGRYDRALYPALQREFAQAIPGCEFHILERSGSFSHVEEPDEVAALTRAFLTAPRG
jgi:proline iminopeptidase